MGSLQTVLPFKLAATDESLTAHGGLALFGEYLRAMGDGSLLDHELPGPGSAVGYDPSAHALPLVLMLAGGGRTLEDLRVLRNDKGLRALLQLEEMPSSDATGDWLRRMGRAKPDSKESDGLAGLQRVNRSVFRRLLRQDDRASYTLDVDATQIVAEKARGALHLQGRERLHADGGAHRRTRPRRRPWYPELWGKDTRQAALMGAACYDFLAWTIPERELLKSRQGAELSLPFFTPPAFATVTEVAPGILWTRIPLPFRLDHVNIYLIEDGDGWAVLDTGVDDEAARAAWETLLAGPLSGKRLTRLIVTHFHPDHIGLAGWLCQRFDLPLLTSQTSYLGCLNISLSPGALDAEPYHDFYARHGLDPATTAHVVGDGHAYLRMVAKLPPTFVRVVAGDTLSIGGRTFSVLTGDGHAPEQVMLYCRSDNLLLCADHVIVKITPNVNVWAVDPEGDPLGLYLRSLAALAGEIDTDPLVLPGHQLPFRGLAERCQQLVDHHYDRCELIAGACRREPQSVADLVPVLFTRQLDMHQLGFAFSEVHAHVNYMLRRGELRQEIMVDGSVRVST